MSFAPHRLPISLRLAVFGAAVAVLLWLTLAPTERLPGAELLWDKAQHALAYFVLTALGLALFPTRGTRLFFGVVILGALVEVLQANMPLGRQGDWRDAVWNAVGALLAVRAAQLVRRRRRGRP